MQARVGETATAAQKLRILIADDHALVRSGFASILGAHEEFSVCGEAADGEAAVALYERLRPDVALIDLQMPGLDGVGAITRIRERDPNACTLVLTTFDTDDDIERALRAGARGYLLKDASVSEFMTAIREVHAGHTRVAPAVAAKLADRMVRVHITSRELTILRLVADGKSNKEIGSALSIAEATVKVHLTHLFEKLEVSSRTEAIAAAARRGLVRIR